MGDVIVATSLLTYLKENYPDSSITFITNSQYAELFFDDPRLTAVYGIGICKKAAEPLFRQKWDLVIDLQNSKKSRQFIKNFEVSNKVGRFRKLHLKRWLLLGLRINTYSPYETVAKRYIESAGAVNPQYVPPIQCYFNLKQHPQLMELLQRDTILRPSIALFPFSAWKNKEWLREYYLEVGRYFIVKGWNVIIMGGPSEANQARELAAFIGHRCVSTAGRVSLYECGCLLTGCTLALGNDTGLSHLARSCGVKTGILYGPTTGHLGFFPFGDPPFKVFERYLICRPCHAHGGNVCIQFNHKCMRTIEPNIVIRGLEDLFHRSVSAHSPQTTYHYSSPEMA